MCGMDRVSLLSVGGGELQKVGWVDFTWVQICRGEWQPGKGVVKASFM